VIMEALRDRTPQNGQWWRRARQTTRPKLKSDAAAEVARHLPATDAHAFHATVASAFVHGAALGFAIPACTVLLTAIITYRYLPRH
jgi:hypothetical protein